MSDDTAPRQAQLPLFPTPARCCAKASIFARLRDVVRFYPFFISFQFDMCAPQPASGKEKARAAFFAS